MKKGDQKGVFTDKKSAEQFNRLACTVFAPVNTAVAHQIVQECGVNRGTAVDIGGGPGHLAIELARITDLTIISLDISACIRQVAAENIRAAGLSDRITAVTGDAAQMPLPDASVDLAVSKGSVFFWPEPAAAFREIRRVLRPGGVAWIGGGFGSSVILQGVGEQMDRFDPTWIDGVRERLGDRTAERFREELKKAGIEEYTLLHDPWQLWIRFQGGKG
ncbi:ubiquinone/menaquinone biosynthesis C-methylase UbiE [Methanofollis sp. W23]|uniref:class I SAM-dependent methyltransferase n=1 Tax=Methanofollis sp. W23 TaxID=2817849 RepID=UPI001AE4AB47|nr:class I SAM-dependent methyltransferase [Methanofollis sp. W23]MBP2146424.1 ubiquinone/menaquinone biosynthesis C-methylase UbiE [Methanofollis sp. W23]